MLFEIPTHFFVHRLDDSSMELQYSCKEGLTFTKRVWQSAQTSP